VTKISRSFYLQDGGKNQLAQIWNKTSRHCYPLYMSFSSERACVPTGLFTLELVTNHTCKKCFLRFFILVTFCNVLTFFYFPKVFYLKKTLAKFRAASRLTRSTFKITATKQTCDFFCCISNDLKCLPINFYLFTMFDALCDGLQGHFVGIWRGVELH